MRIDATLMGGLAEAAASAKDLEAAGYDGAWTAETAHDPFLPLVQAAADTSSIELGTSIAVAFARNPMLLANLGWDLQAFSKGRFVLGLGSQIKPHITKRFSMEWSSLWLACGRRSTPSAPSGTPGRTEQNSTSVEIFISTH